MMTKTQAEPVSPAADASVSPKSKDLARSASGTGAADSNGGKAKAIDEAHGRRASYGELLQNATASDYVLMVIGTLGGIASGLSMPFFNVLFGRLLNGLNTDPSSFSSVIDTLCLIMVYVAIANVVAGTLQIGCWMIVGERQTQRFRERYVNAILSQEIGWFDTCGAAELSTRVAELTGKLQDGLGPKIGDMIQYATQFVGSFIVALYLCWKLTVVLIAAIPAIGLSGAFMINAITAATTQSLEQYSAAGGLATESLGAVRTVTALNMQPDVITRYRVFLFRAMQAGIVKGFKVGLGNGLLFGVSFCTYALGFWYGAKLVADDIQADCTEHCLSGGIILSVFFCVIIGSMSLGQLAPPLSCFTQAQAALALILDTINRKPLIDGLSEEGAVLPADRVRGRVDINEVVFAYPSRPEINVCRGYSLQIKPGESVALVGASGCGKSTVINLLLRFYDPQAGCIQLDGADIKGLNLRWLRSQIGYVGQEPVLFAGSIGDNIAYGLSPDIVNSTDPAVRAQLKEQIVAAAKLANAHDFIKGFPQGYDTDVGSNGVAMSGGQKQRIAIARALVKKPVILLLDEATSALDAASERVVQQSIDELQKNKSHTTIVIAHRLSTIRNADRICLIHQGSIAESGTHDELIARNGLYADLVSLQMHSLDLEAEAPEAETPPAEGDVAYMTAAEESKTAAEGSKRKLSLDAPHKSSFDAGGGSPRSRRDSQDKTAEKATEEEEPEVSKEEKGRLNKLIWERLMQHWMWLAVAVGGAAVFGAIFPVWGFLLARTQAMFYLHSAHKIRERSVQIAIYFLVLGAVALVSAIFQFWGMGQVGERVSASIRSDMFEALMRHNVGFFDEERNSIGSLTTRLSDDSRIVSKAFSDTLARALQAAFTLLIGLGIAFSASWRIAFVVLACFPISIAASAIRMRAMSGQQHESADETGESGGNKSKAKNKKKKAAANKKGGDKAEGKDGSPKSSESSETGSQGAVISSAFTHMRTVSAFSMQHRVSEHYAKITEVQSQERRKRGVIAGAAFGSANGSLFLIYALLFWYGSRLIKSGQVTFVDLMTAILALMLGAVGLGQALSDMSDQQEGLMAARRIFEAIDAGRASSIDGLSTTGARMESDQKVHGRIEFKNVSFRYPTRQDVEVCKDYNLVIEPGQMVALVGPSGSGKSTIINLLLRFYDPLSGEITLDGRNIRDYNVRWLRSQLGYVGQEPALFTGSVAENIAKGRADRLETPLLTMEEAMREADDAQTDLTTRLLVGNGDLCGGGQHVQRGAHAAVPTKDVEMGQTDGVADDVVQACIAANAHEFIKAFPQGYDTEVGEGSIMVSGGQKQRIAIARALVKRPSVLLLDEATSALDATSERVVQQSIDALQQARAQTTIVIAHRLSTIRSADKIVVVDKGHVVEMGTHDELLAKEGLYAQLWAKQGGASVSRGLSSHGLSANGDKAI